MVLSCLSDMAHKKRKIANSFRNISYENKLPKVVKLNKRWVMDASKRYINDKVLYSEICGISRRQLLNIKKSLLQLLIEEENPDTFLV